MSPVGDQKLSLEAHGLVGRKVRNIHAKEDTNKREAETKASWNPEEGKSIPAESNGKAS